MSRRSAARVCGRRGVVHFVPMFAAFACIVLTVTWPRYASAQSEVEAPPVEVIGHYETGIGTSDAASQGSANAKLILERPTLRAGEVLEFVPGMIVTQHSGSGKANQYYLRGFNLDHGTDFAVYVDGMPVNMRSHGHGQGYADINFVIPELVSRIDFRKGPYFAEEADFASAGAAHFRLYDQMKQGLGLLTLGTDQYRRGLVAGSLTDAADHLLYALEWTGYDGPWTLPEDSRKLNGVLRFSNGDGNAGLNVTAMAYRAKWNSTDQIPRRAVEAGQLDRFGHIDPTDGGVSDRYSLSAEVRHLMGNGRVRANVYFIQYKLDLWSNFTYFLADPVNGDQFQQTDDRKIYGGELHYSLPSRWGGIDMENRVGLQLRYDDIAKVALYTSRARRIIATTREDRVGEGSAGLFAENVVQWSTWLRTIAGVRADHFRFDTQSSIAANSGARNDSIVSPKLSVVLGPWSKTEYFINYGLGFHSNDARGTVISVDPSTGNPAQRVTPLVRTQGGEIGARTQLVDSVQSSLSFWRLTSNSELLFIGDAGTTEAGRPSRREGIEWITTWRPRSWLMLDLEVALSKSRFTDGDPAGDHIPGSPERTLQAGLYLENLGPWAAALQVRHFGPRPLVEDNRVRSGSTTLTNLRLGYDISHRWQAHFDVLNLFNRKDSDVDYYYCSLQAGETSGVCADGSAGVDDIHFHPVEPRQFRLTLNIKF